MKTTTIITSLLLGFLVAITSSMQAQTKKIAWRSHGGSNMTFNFAMPDDFGLPDPDFYERLKEKQLVDSSQAMDSLAVCTPASSAQLPPPVSPSKKQQQAEKLQEKKKQQQQKKQIRQQYKQKIKALKEEKKEAIKNQEANTIQVQKNINTPAPQGVTQWLWLLLLPLALVFGVSIKQP